MCGTSVPIRHWCCLAIGQDSLEDLKVGVNKSGV